MNMKRRFRKEGIAPRYIVLGLIVAIIAIVFTSYQLQNQKMTLSSRAADSVCCRPGTICDGVCVSSTRCSGSCVNINPPPAATCRNYGGSCIGTTCGQVHMESGTGTCSSSTEYCCRPIPTATPISKAPPAATCEENGGSCIGATCSDAHMGIGTGTCSSSYNHCCKSNNAPIPTNTPVPTATPTPSSSCVNINGSCYYNNMCCSKNCVSGICSAFAPIPSNIPIPPAATCSSYGGSCIGTTCGQVHMESGTGTCSSSSEYCCRPISTATPLPKAPPIPAGRKTMNAPAKINTSIVNSGNCNSQYGGLCQPSSTQCSAFSMVNEPSGTCTYSDEHCCKANTAPAPPVVQKPITTVEQTNTPAENSNLTSYMSSCNSTVSNFLFGKPVTKSPETCITEYSQKLLSSVECRKCEHGGGSCIVDKNIQLSCVLAGTGEKDSDVSDYYGNGSALTSTNSLSTVCGHADSPCCIRQNLINTPDISTWAMYMGGECNGGLECKVNYTNRDNFFSQCVPENKNFVLTEFLKKNNIESVDALQNMLTLNAKDLKPRFLNDITKGGDLLCNPQCSQDSVCVWQEAGPSSTTSTDIQPSGFVCVSRSKTELSYASRINETIISGNGTLGAKCIVHQIGPINTTFLYGNGCARDDLECVNNICQLSKDGAKIATLNSQSYDAQQVNLSWSDPSISSLAYNKGVASAYCTNEYGYFLNAGVCYTCLLARSGNKILSQVDAQFCNDSTLQATLPGKKCNSAGGYCSANQNEACTQLPGSNDCPGTCCASPKNTFTGPIDILHMPATGTQGLGGSCVDIQVVNLRLNLKSTDLKRTDDDPLNKRGANSECAPGLECHNGSCLDTVRLAYTDDHGQGSFAHSTSKIPVLGWIVAPVLTSLSVDYYKDAEIRGDVALQQMDTLKDKPQYAALSTDVFRSLDGSAKAAVLVTQANRGVKDEEFKGLGWDRTTLTVGAAVGTFISAYGGEQKSNSIVEGIDTGVQADKDFAMGRITAQQLSGIKFNAIVTPVFQTAIVFTDMAMFGGVSGAKKLGEGALNAAGQLAAKDAASNIIAAGTRRVLADKGVNYFGSGLVRTAEKLASRDAASEIASKGLMKVLDDKGLGYAIQGAGDLSRARVLGAVGHTAARSEITSAGIGQVLRGRGLLYTLGGVGELGGATTLRAVASTANGTSTALHVVERAVATPFTAVGKVLAPLNIPGTLGRAVSSVTQRVDSRIISSEADNAFTRMYGSMTGRSGAIGAERAAQRSLAEALNDNVDHALLSNPAEIQSAYNSALSTGYKGKPQEFVQAWQKAISEPPPLDILPPRFDPAMATRYQADFARLSTTRTSAIEPQMNRLARDIAGNSDMAKIYEAKKIIKGETDVVKAMAANPSLSRDAAQAYAKLTHQAKITGVTFTPEQVAQQVRGSMGGRTGADVTTQIDLVRARLEADGVLSRAKVVQQPAAKQLPNAAANNQPAPPSLKQGLKSVDQIVADAQRIEASVNDGSLFGRSSTTMISPVDSAEIAAATAKQGGYDAAIHSTADVFGTAGDPLLQRKFAVIKGVDARGQPVFEIVDNTFNQHLTDNAQAIQAAGLSIDDPFIKRLAQTGHAPLTDPNLRMYGRYTAGIGLADKAAISTAKADALPVIASSGDQTLAENFVKRDFVNNQGTIVQKTQQSLEDFFNQPAGIVSPGTRISKSAAPPIDQNVIDLAKENTSARVAGPGYSGYHGQDSIGVYRTGEIKSSYVDAMSLSADGHGPNGEFASGYAKNRFPGLFDYYSNLYRGKNPKQAMDDAIKQLNIEVKEQMRNSLGATKAEQSGTTLTAAVRVGDTVYTAQMGDSRLYLIDRNGRITQMTKDHNWGNMADSQGYHPQAGIAVSRSLGDEQVVNTLNAIGQKREATLYGTPEITSFKVNRGDILVTGSDSLEKLAQGMGSEDNLQHFLQTQVRANSPTVATENILNQAHAYNVQDDISVAVYRVESTSRRLGVSQRIDLAQQPIAATYNPNAGKALSTQAEVIYHQQEKSIGRLNIDSSNTTISRSHAVVRMDQSGNVYIRDAHSANGTYVDGIKIDTTTGTYLDNGQIVQMGDQRLTFHQNSQGAQLLDRNGNVVTEFRYTAAPPIARAQQPLAQVVANNLAGGNAAVPAALSGANGSSKVIGSAFASPSFEKAPIRKGLFGSTLFGTPTLESTQHGVKLSNIDVLVKSNRAGEFVLEPLNPGDTIYINGTKYAGEPLNQASGLLDISIGNRKAKKYGIQADSNGDLQLKSFDQLNVNPVVSIDRSKFLNPIAAQPVIPIPQGAPAAAPVAPVQVLPVAPASPVRAQGIKTITDVKQTAILPDIAVKSNASADEFIITPANADTTISIRKANGSIVRSSSADPVSVKPGEVVYATKGGHSKAYIIESDTTGGLNLSEDSFTDSPQLLVSINKSEVIASAGSPVVAPGARPVVPAAQIAPQAQTALPAAPQGIFRRQVAPAQTAAPVSALPKENIGFLGRTQVDSLQSVTDARPLTEVPSVSVKATAQSRFILDNSDPNIKITVNGSNYQRGNTISIGAKIEITDASNNVYKYTVNQPLFSNVPQLKNAKGAIVIANPTKLTESAGLAPPPRKGGIFGLGRTTVFDNTNQGLRLGADGPLVKVNEQGYFILDDPPSGVTITVGNSPYTSKQPIGLGTNVTITKGGKATTYIVSQDSVPGNYVFKEKSGRLIARSDAGAIDVNVTGIPKITNDHGQSFLEDTRQKFQLRQGDKSVVISANDKGELVALIYGDQRELKINGHIITGQRSYLLKVNDVIEYDGNIFKVGETKLGRTNILNDVASNRTVVTPVKAKLLKTASTISDDVLNAVEPPPSMAQSNIFTHPDQQKNLAGGAILQSNKDGELIITKGGLVSEIEVTNTSNITSRADSITLHNGDSAVIKFKGQTIKYKVIEDIHGNLQLVPLDANGVPFTANAITADKVQLAEQAQRAARSTTQAAIVPAPRAVRAQVPVPASVLPQAPKVNILKPLLIGGGLLSAGAFAFTARNFIISSVYTPRTGINSGLDTVAPGTTNGAPSEPEPGNSETSHPDTSISPIPSSPVDDSSPGEVIISTVPSVPGKDISGAPAASTVDSSTQIVPPQDNTAGPAGTKPNNATTPVNTQKSQAAATKAPGNTAEKVVSTAPPASTSLGICGAAYPCNQSTDTVACDNLHCVPPQNITCQSNNTWGPPEGACGSTSQVPEPVPTPLPINAIITTGYDTGYPNCLSVVPDGSCVKSASGYNQQWNNQYLYCNGSTNTFFSQSAANGPDQGWLTLADCQNRIGGGAQAYNANTIQNVKNVLEQVAGKSNRNSNGKSQCVGFNTGYGGCKAVGDGARSCVYRYDVPGQTFGDQFLYCCNDDNGSFYAKSAATNSGNGYHTAEECLTVSRQ